MPVTVDPASLADIPAFRDMSEAEIKDLVEISERMQFHDGEMILREGKSTQFIWIVVEGCCEVVKRLGNGHETVLARIEAPSIFGEMSFFQPAPHSASVRARGDVSVLRIGRREFDLLIGNGSLAGFKLAYNSVRVLADRLRRMDQRFAELVEECGDDGQKAEWGDFRAKLHGDWNV